MKTLYAALFLAALGTQALAYEYRSDWEQQQRRQAEITRSEDLRTQVYQQNLKLQQLEQQERVERRENEWRMRQLEAEQHRPGWR